MNRWIVRIAAKLLLGCAVTPMGAQATAAAGDWRKVMRLRSGSSLVVAGERGPGAPDSEESCKLTEVDAQTLRCEPYGPRGPRLIFPAPEVRSVQQFRYTNGLSIPRMLLFAGLGFLMGAVITDGNLDWPLAIVGAVSGGLYGLSTGTRTQRLVPIYRHSSH